METRRLRLCVGVLLLAGCSLRGTAATTTVAEQARVARWAEAKFQQRILAPENSNYIVLDREGLEQNGHLGRPLRIGDRDFSDGLFFGQTSSITVHLASPGKRFEAIAGVDGRYNACGYSTQKQKFSIYAGDFIVQSPEIAMGDSGAALQANLRGVTEFRITDGNASGSGWCKEAVLANARVTLEDGSRVRLGDLPIGPDVDAADTALPFSFTYDGRPSYAFLGSWTRKSSSRSLDEHRTETDLSWKDPSTGLLVELVARSWSDYPVVEWTVYLENTSDVPTPILENVLAVDTVFAVPLGSRRTLHHFRGSPNSPRDFEPFLTSLDNASPLHLATSGGRSTDAAMPNFNLEAAGRGVIMALGWPGQWKADFALNERSGVQLRAGQELTHFRLLPHERVRTPLVALLFWNGTDWLRGQNLWRSWMLSDNMPRFSDGKIAPRMAGSSSQWFDEMVHATEENQKRFIESYSASGIKPDFWWMDAGWYINDGDWWNTGTWKIDPARFPHGIKPIIDFAHQRGMESIVWFELERVTRDRALWKERPEWLLRDPQSEARGLRLLNLGNPEAKQWALDLLERMIREQGIDVYRIDFNIAPLPFWRNSDAPDRQGITEIFYVTAFLDYLDQLHRAFPRLQIDTCASGGRRDDLETLRRAVPMHRSDYVFEPTGTQNISYGAAFWIPYFGTPSDPRDNYVFRSAWSPQINMGWDVRRKDLDYPWMRESVAQWRIVAQEMLGDYYPLLPYDPSESAWMAWQFHRSESGTGALQVFRRAQSDVTTVRLRLHGLEPDARYAITSFDGARTRVYSTEELEDRGLEVHLPELMSSAVFTYKRQRL